MNIVNISGYVKRIQFRGNAKTKQLYADVIIDVIDEVRPDKEPLEIWLTDRHRAKAWRKVEVGNYIELRGQIRPALGFTKNGNVAHECTIDPMSFRTQEKDISQELRDEEYIRKIIDDAVEGNDDEWGRK